MDRHFEVGDRVVFRAWEDLVSEYGEDSDGDTLITDDDAYFTKMMRALCGSEATVNRVYFSPYGNPRIALCDAERDLRSWKFSPHMFDLAGSDDDVQIDEAGFLEVLSV